MDLDGVRGNVFGVGDTCKLLGSNVNFYLFSYLCLSVCLYLCWHLLMFIELFLFVNRELMLREKGM